MSDMLDFLRVLSTIMAHVRESVGDQKNVEWHVTRWEDDKALIVIQIQYDGSPVNRYAYRSVYRDGSEGSIRYMDQDEATWRISSNSSDFRWLRDSEMPEGKDRIRVWVPRRTQLLEVSLINSPERKPLDLSTLEF